jgi:hypothetical protein
VRTSKGTSGVTPLGAAWRKARAGPKLIRGRGPVNKDDKVAKLMYFSKFCFFLLRRVLKFHVFEITRQQPRFPLSTVYPGEVPEQSSSVELV